MSIQLLRDEKIMHVVGGSVTVTLTNTDGGALGGDPAPEYIVVQVDGSTTDPGEILLERFIGRPIDSR